MLRWTMQATERTYDGHLIGVVCVVAVLAAPGRASPGAPWPCAESHQKEIITVATKSFFFSLEQEEELSVVRTGFAASSTQGPVRAGSHKGRSVLGLEIEVCGRHGGVTPCRLDGGP